MMYVLLTLRVPNGVSAILVTRDAMVKPERTLIKSNISAVDTQIITSMKVTITVHFRISVLYNLMKQSETATTLR
jgi:hypothetical protein